MSVLIRADITKYHRLGDLNNRYLFSYSSGGWNSKTKVKGLVSSEASLLGLQRHFGLCPHMAFAPCGRIPGVFGVQTASSEDINQIGLGSSLMASF